MTPWFRLTLLCLALLCLSLNLTQPADLHPQLQIVGSASWFDRGIEPAPDAPTVSVVRSMEFPARAAPRPSLFLDGAWPARHTGPPGWASHGPPRRIPALAVCARDPDLRP